ncbi:hypothetical protein ScalyP_jg9765 [Parmales sp. scaly parma]|nr:hypothetical protein ScalyP_jg9765 [Parmales sp. scaly parma]
MHLYKSITKVKVQHPDVEFEIYRVPFLLEPGYENQPDNWWETHDSRMIRRFGSASAFDRVKKSQNLIGRGAEVGLDVSIGYTQEALTNRKQSCTIKSHRLILHVTEKYGTKISEDLYEALNVEHFLHSGVLNDPELLLSTAIEILGASHGDEIDAFLKSNEKYEEVKMTLRSLEQLGIESIPTLVINGDLQYAVNGAMPSEKLTEVLLEVITSIKNNSSQVNDRLFSF